jgi:YbgC/YbaW family acyl-CoA thioester hydrolase
MESIEYHYEVIVRESLLDVMGHLNHAAYLTLFEEARWDICAKQGMTIEAMQERGVGLVVIEAQIQYRKEVRARDRLIIKTRFSDVERKIWRVVQTMEKSSGELCSTIQIKGTVFDLKTRKIIAADAEWRSVFLGQKIR